MASPFLLHSFQNFDEERDGVLIAVLRPDALLCCCGGILPSVHYVLFKRLNSFPDNWARRLEFAFGPRRENPELPPELELSGLPHSVEQTDQHRENEVNHLFFHVCLHFKLWDKNIFLSIVEKHPPKLY